MVKRETIADVLYTFLNEVRNDEESTDAIVVEYSGTIIDLFADNDELSDYYDDSDYDDYGWED